MSRWYQNKPPPGTPLKPEHPQLAGLVGWWLFQEGSGDRVQDLSGNGNVGTLNSFTFPATTLSGWNPGRTGRTLAYDANDNFVDTKDIDSLDGANQVSAFCWIKRVNLARDLGIIVKWDFPTQGTFGFQTGRPLGDEFTCFIATTLTDVGGGCRVDSVNANSLAQIWAHVGFVFDGSQVGNANRLKMYLDGNQLDVNQGAGNVPTSLTSGGTATVKIGKFGGSLTRYFNGLIDDVRIYNRALTQSEIQDVYTNPFGAFATLDISTLRVASLMAMERSISRRIHSRIFGRVN